MQTLPGIRTPVRPADRAAVRPTPRTDAQERFRRFAAFVLLYNLPVILFGAFVRATGSGAGCGSHWPLCNGQVLPRPENVKSLIEFSHRIMSGLDGFFVLALVVAAWRVFPAGHRVRRAAIFALFFTILEALIGRALVKNGWVADNDSAGRAIVLALHLVNTFLLLGALALTAGWAAGLGRLRLREQGAVGGALAISVFAALILGANGAVTALGDTILPVHSTGEAVAQAFAPGAHYLARLRLAHPFLALSVGLYLVLVAGLLGNLRPAPSVRRWGRALTALFCLQIGVGLLNKTLAAPVAMQLLHLLLADLVWVSLVFLAAAGLAEETPRLERVSVPAQERATWRDYVALTKPRVISLLLFTTLAAMLIAARGWPGSALFLAVALGGYLSAGAANAINMVLDRDIDGRMRRTAGRPTVTQRIPPQSALLFGLALAVASFAILWGAANLLAALLSLAGMVFYVIVYTLLLKRRTWYNIVIGGAAGAFPPLVGWAAVTGELSLLAWFLFAIIFLWTPVHFWALALLLKEDYRAAGVPMLPVVRGERYTVIQIGGYAVLTVLLTLLPLATPAAGLGWGYLAAAAGLGGVLLARSVQLWRRIERPQTVRLYKYSMLYLALLFLAMAVDRMV
jgi:protoheme IX farnesyltransferase